MPPFTEILPVIHVSTFKSWDETAEWMRGILVDAFESNDELESHRPVEIAMHVIRENMAQSYVADNDAAWLDMLMYYSEDPTNPFDTLKKVVQHFAQAEFLIELEFLNGRSKIKDYKTSSLIKY